jgi:hypothetical protein
MNEITRRQVLLSAIFIVTAVGIALVATRIRTNTIPIQTSPLTQQQTPDFASLEPRINRFCGDCHAVPDPNTFPRAAWYDEVAQGYNFYRESKRSDLDAPPMSEVVAYYRALAPEQLAVPVSDSGTSPDIQFEQSTMRPPHGVSFASVSHIHRLTSTSGETTLVACDMRSGAVQTVGLRDTEIYSEPVIRLANPAHVEACDLDADGVTDFVVAELGSFLPEDHNKGSVIWLRPTGDGRTGEPVVLFDGVGRVADVQPADFDSDGDLDLVVAEFGWRTTGRILLLEQVDLTDGIPQFEDRVIDTRHGTIHVPVVDLNNDGHLDFVALVSQEFESVDAFINIGDGTFRKEAVLASGDPSFGSSGIQIVDLDQDGDPDVLYTNGDSLDSKILKPYHAIHWLENRGSFPFEHHHLTDMPGVSRAVAGDLDGDGDLDVVASSFLPEKLLNSKPPGAYDTLIWLRQTAPGEFERFRLENTTCGHLSLELADLDGDQDLDIAVGNHDSSISRDPLWLTIWRNQLK